MLCRICLWNQLVQGFCVLGVFWLLLQFHLLLSVYSGFLLLLDSVLDDYMFLKISPFHPDFQISWHIVVQSTLTILCISLVSVLISPLSFLILFIWVLSLFFFMSLLKGLSILFIFSKNHLPDLLILRNVLLVSMSLILLWSWLFPSFYLLWAFFLLLLLLFL